MPDKGQGGPRVRAEDWAGDWRAFIVLWGVPGAAMLMALLLGPRWRAVVWTIMLVWMGVACLLNARRCSRTHCRITGPFFLAMAGLVVAYAAGLAPLGPYGWPILGAITLGGFIGLWWGSERLWGAYRLMGGKPSADEP